LRTGLAVSRAVEAFAPPLAGLVWIKWPNDVLIRDTGGARKVAGILTESDGSAVYIGIGVNVSQTEFPPELRRKAVSITQALLRNASPGGGIPGPAGAVPAREGEGKEPSPPPPSSAGDRITLLELILSRLYRELQEPAGRGDGPWRAPLEERLYMRGEPVRFIAGGADSGQLVEGLLLGIGPGGELRILPPGGTEQTFVTGELDLYT
jgi:BirA family biotin operon repressor/biotin-[acetyl-CoA-carboxylase] ligase